MSHRKIFLEQLAKSSNTIENPKTPLTSESVANQFLNKNTSSSWFQGAESIWGLLQQNLAYALIGFDKLTENNAKSKIVQVAKGTTVNADENKKAADAVKWYGWAATIKSVTDFGFMFGTPLVLSALGMPVLAGVGFASLGLLFSVPGIIDRFSRWKQLKFVNEKIASNEEAPANPVAVADKFLESKFLTGIPALFSNVEKYLSKIGGVGIGVLGAFGVAYNSIQNNIPEAIRSGMFMLNGAATFLRGNIVSRPEQVFFDATRNFINVVSEPNPK